MLKDLRYAVHIIVKDRWYSVVAVVALSLGIGVNATVFTLVNAILNRGLPYKDSGQLYMVGSMHQNGERDSVAILDLQDWRSQSRSFSGFAGFSNQGTNVSDDRSAPQNARSAALTANSFSLLGEAPLLGRDFSPADEQPGAESVVLIGYKMWKTRYALDRDVIGKPIRLEGKPATIIGVMAEGMEFPSNTELWTPFVPSAEQQKRSSR